LAVSYSLHADSLLGLFFHSEDVDDVFLRKVGFDFRGIYDVISQNTEYLISTDVRASDLTGNILAT
jgi:hypothetical protein